MSSVDLVHYAKLCLQAPKMFDERLFSSNLTLENKGDLSQLSQDVMNSAVRSKGEVLRDRDARWVKHCGQRARLQFWNLGIIGIWNAAFCAERCLAELGQDHFGSFEHIAGNGLLLCLAIRDLALKGLDWGDLEAPYRARARAIDDVAKRMLGLMQQRLEVVQSRYQSVFEKGGEEFRGDLEENPEMNPLQKAFTDLAGAFAPPPKSV